MSTLKYRKYVLYIFISDLTWLLREIQEKIPETVLPFFP